MRFNSIAIFHDRAPLSMDEEGAQFIHGIVSIFEVNKKKKKSKFLLNALRMAWNKVHRGRT